MFVSQLKTTGLPIPSPRRLIRAARLTPGERVLEIRPYEGRIARHVAEHLGPDGRLDLIDIPEHMLDQAVHHIRTRATSHAAPVVPTVADPRVLPFADDTFTCVYLVGILPPLPDPGRVLDELHRVLHPTGRLVIADHRRRFWLPPQQVRHLARRHGFAVVTQRGRSRYVQVLHPLRETHQPLVRQAEHRDAPDDVLAHDRVNAILVRTRRERV
jgi:ubiquinone/menaquinone biosynthesis C-methylase UbiE